MNKNPKNSSSISRLYRQCHLTTVGLSALLVLAGCTITNPPPAPLPPPLLGGAPVPTVVAIAPPAPPAITLPRFLGLDVLGRGIVVGARHVRLKLATRFPVLQPTVANAPKPIGDPANLQSPSPTIASAAAVQQAEADAPAKIQALGYLGTLDCGQYPEAEFALLAGMDDITAAVRAAAVEAVIAAQRTCSRGCGCSCGGCCTPEIRAKLTHMAFDMDDANCFCEPDARVRRLCRIALAACGGPAPDIVVPTPEEVPPPAVLELVQPLPSPG